MDNAIVGAVIAAAASVICQLIIVAQSKRERNIKDAVKDAKMEDRLNSIEKKLDEHNGYASKFETITGAVIELKNDLKWIKESIDDRR